MFKRTWIDETVEVATSADTLYSLLKDIKGWPAWTRGLKAIKVKGRDTFGVGTRFAMVLDGGLRFPCEMYTYGPSRLEWGGGLAGSTVRHSFEITPIDATRCRLRHLEYATGLLAALALPIEKAIYAYDHRWTKTICARFESSN
jgi:hypothetical protein